MSERSMFCVQEKFARVALQTYAMESMRYRSMFCLQEKFARVALQTYAMESMTYMTAATMDRYEEPDVSVESAIVKV